MKLLLDTHDEAIAICANLDLGVVGAIAIEPKTNSDGVGEKPGF